MVWTGDPGMFIRNILEFFYYKVYVNYRPTAKRIAEFNKRFEKIISMFDDLSDATIISIEEFDRVLPKSVSDLLPALIDELISLNEDSPGQETSVSAACIVLDENSHVVRVVIGQNTFEMPEKYKEVLSKYYHRTIHAEGNAIIKCLGEGLLKDGYAYYMVIIRNGGDVPARPCGKCRSLMTNEFGTYTFTLIYPLIGKFFIIERIGGEGSDEPAN